MARQYRNKLYSVGEQDVLTCALSTAFELGLNETFAPMLRTGSMQMGLNTSASEFVTWKARDGTEDPLTSPQLPASTCDDNIGAGTPGGYLPSMQIKVSITLHHRQVLCSAAVHCCSVLSSCDILLTAPVSLSDVTLNHMIDTRVFARS
jgi:hypothetical protein